MGDKSITITMRKVLESLKRNEQSQTTVKKEFVNDNDKDLIQMLGSDYNSEKDLIIDAELLKLVKVEDWFKDGTTFKKVIRKGKGRQPAIDSTVKCKNYITNDIIIVRLKITVNDEKVITNNYKEGDPTLQDD